MDQKQLKPKEASKEAGLLSDDDDQFDSDNFDPISFINKKFPDQNSMVNLDKQIDNLKQQLERKNNDLMKSVHEHAMVNRELQSQIKQAQQVTIDVIQQIGTIKEKAEKSEKLVYQMCQDIKSLDTAKKNLTFSITALQQFIMMLTAVEKLKENCQKRQYKEVTNLVSAFQQLSSHFKQYQNIPQIQELIKEKDDEIKKLKKQLDEDFAAFHRGATTLTVADMVSACSVIQNLGVKFKTEMVLQISGMILSQGQQMFSAPDANTLDKYQRRFHWFRKSLQEFETKWTGVFPEYWGMPCFLIHEFCSLTRIDITRILETQGNLADVSLLMKALITTIQFENSSAQEMTKRFAVFLVEESNSNNEFFQPEQIDLNSEVKEILNQKREFVITRLPKIKETISVSFQNYLGPYIRKEEEDLFNYINKALREEKHDEGSQMFTSSLMIFKYIKDLKTRAVLYSQQRLLIEINKFSKIFFATQIINRCLDIYAQELVQVILSTDQNKTKDESVFEATVCYAVNTAEFSNDTIQRLSESFQTSIDANLKDKIDFNAASDSMVKVVNRGIETLLGFVDGKLDAHFSDMQKNDILDTGGDSSDFIQATRLFLLQHINRINVLITESYRIFYLNKIVVLINGQFMYYLYKIKKTNDGTFRQLLVDTTELENILCNLAQTDNQSQAMQSFVNFVSQTFLKTQNLLKLLDMPAQSFVNNFSNFLDLESITAQELDKIAILKGLQQSDMISLYKGK